MSRRSAAHPAPKPLDVCSTDAKRHESRHLKKDKRAYAQVYLAQTRIEGIETWRAAVDAALQAAEGGEQQATDMNRWWAEEEMQQKKSEAAGDGHIEVLEQEVWDQLLITSSFLLMTSS